MHILRHNVHTTSRKAFSSLMRMTGVTLSNLRKPSLTLETANQAALPFNPVEELAKARGKLYKQKDPKELTDTYYAEQLGLRSLPVPTFLSSAPASVALPITSINEDRLLVELGIVHAERNQIEGLHSSSSRARGGHVLSEEQLSSIAISRLAANPPPEVGIIQRRTQKWMLRPFPLGLRFSGKNMSPLPGWLAGAQSVALNMSNNDLAVHLHFALFNGSDGYVLKPEEMLSTSNIRSTEGGEDPRTTRLPLGERFSEQSNEDYYWPPPRENLHRTSIEPLSLHHLPKRGEVRPRFNGTRGACHKFASELSGGFAPPDASDASSAMLTFSVHPIGGFCAVSKLLPLPQNTETEVSTVTIRGNGLNPEFRETIHCVAAEPHATFVRISVSDNGHDVAYESAVLGRLRRGYRVFQLRSMLGTRIELCYLFVRISFGQVPNRWSTPRQLRIQSKQDREEIIKLRDEVQRLKHGLAI